MHESAAEQAQRWRWREKKEMLFVLSQKKTTPFKVAAATKYIVVQLLWILIVRTSIRVWYSSEKKKRTKAKKNARVRDRGKENSRRKKQILNNK